VILDFFTDLPCRSGTAAGGNQCEVRREIAAQEKEWCQWQRMPMQRFPEDAPTKLRWGATMSIAIEFFQGHHGGDARSIWGSKSVWKRTPIGPTPLAGAPAGGPDFVFDRQPMATVIIWTSVWAGEVPDVNARLVETGIGRRKFERGHGFQSTMMVDDESLVIA